MSADLLWKGRRRTDLDFESLEIIDAQKQKLKWKEEPYVDYHAVSDAVGIQE